VNTKLFVCFLAVVLTACINIPTGDENSPFVPVPVGSSLVLKRSIVVPAERFDAYLQEADNAPAALNRDERDAGCILEMRNRQKSPRTIEPATFSITKVADGLYYTMRRVIQVAFDSIDTPTTETHTVTLYLHSDKYPNVRSVSCEVDADFATGYPVTIATIRWALGGHFDLRIAGTKS